MTTIAPDSPTVLQRVIAGTALAACAAVVVMSAPTSDSPGIPAIHVWRGDCFAENSQPNPHTSAPVGIQNWVSWKMRDPGTGRLILGPFVAPPTLSVAMIGYPNKPGNRLYLEKLYTAEQQEIEDPGSEDWHDAVIALPASWVGEEVRLIAIDEATGPEGWLGISEPYDPAKRIRGMRLTVWARSLRAFCVLWLLLTGLWTAAQKLPVCRALDETSRPLTGLALVFVGAYVAFWLYFLHPLVGYAGSLAAVAIAGYGWFLIVNAPRRSLTTDNAALLALTAFVGAFSLSLLAITDIPLPLPQLAQLRFIPGLPVDNSIPGRFADRLYAGQSPRLIIGDWLSSDRPPLQAGWVLLARPACDWFYVDRDASTYVSGVVAQLAWVPAMWWAVRWLGLPTITAGFLVVMSAATGFFVQNTTFVWPKLLAGSMALGAGLLLLDEENHASGRGLRWPWAAVLAALATLAHGGAWFSNLGLIPFFIAGRPLRSLGTTCISCGLAASLLLPWMLYQKLYEPPGDRLLKWHLAGRVAPDESPLTEVVVSAYAKKPLREIVSARWHNLLFQFAGSYASLADPRTDTMLDRRKDEGRCSFRAVGWWNLGWIVALVAACRRPTTGAFAAFQHRWNRLALWAVATFVVWIGLLFGPRTATIAHGSHALQMSLFVLPATLLAIVSPGLLMATSFLAVAGFVSTWAPVAPWLTGTGYSASAVTLALASWITAMALCTPFSDRRTDAASIEGVR